jgi:hypothetical protein
VDSGGEAERRCEEVRGSSGVEKCAGREGDKGLRSKDELAVDEGEEERRCLCLLL